MKTPISVNLGMWSWKTDATIWECPVSTSASKTAIQFKQQNGWSLT